MKKVLLVFIFFLVSGSASAYSLSNGLEEYDCDDLRTWDWQEYSTPLQNGITSSNKKDICVGSSTRDKKNRFEFFVMLPQRCLEDKFCTKVVLWPLNNTRSVEKYKKFIHLISKNVCEGQYRINYKEKITKKWLNVPMPTTTEILCLETKTRWEKKQKELEIAKQKEREKQQKKEKEKKDIEDSKIIAASSGTGFFVSTNGHMVTNNHVIDSCDIVQVHYKGKKLNADVLFTDRTNDLAIIKANIKPEKVFSVSNEDVSLLEDIIVAGYPLGKNISASIKTFKGSVTALAGFGDNYSNFQIDASLSSGNSGGPIINQKGNVVGVAVEKLIEVGVEGFNFGVKSSTLKTFASSNQFKFQDALTQELSNKELGELITEATIYLECWMTVAKINQIIEEGERQKAFFSEYK